MNYRHAFHAGNHADVLKHSLLLALIAALKRKPAPIFVLDTHAGRGSYALDGDEATRSGEALAGVRRLLESAPQSPPLRDYLRELAAFDASTPMRRYPGSPCLLQAALGKDDRMAVCELHPQEADGLRLAMNPDPRVAVHQRDGYEAIRALLPPRQGRGLVLIDPPYEAREAEFDRVLLALEQILSRWSTACVAVWYPIKDRAAVRRFLRAALELPSRAAWDARLMIRADSSVLRMNGSGMLLLNPPWQLDESFHPALSELACILGEDTGGSSGLTWLRRDGQRVEIA
ncbi:MAG: 23S rRNA (adenine(2030)-N(6))-methyltransferase RlmJ [Lysobacteraceae bacterium]